MMILFERIWDPQQYNSYKRQSSKQRMEKIIQTRNGEGKYTEFPGKSESIWLERDNRYMHHLQLG